ncbi:MAG: chromosomal replication initiator protein DnaA, partial [Oceanicaulis sp.]|nr:chromosomal replication initiator protein DnaA [Oceanicaulis sp.]
MGFLQTANAAVRTSEAGMNGSGAVLDVWRAVRARLRAEYGDILYAAEIARLRVEEDRDGRVCVICPNAFGRSWAEDNLGARLRAIWASVEAAPRDIVITTEAAMARQVAEPVTAGAGASGRSALHSSAARAARSPNPAPPAGEGRAPRVPFDPLMIGSANIMAAPA